MIILNREVSFATLWTKFDTFGSRNGFDEMKVDNETISIETEALSAQLPFNFDSHLLPLDLKIDLLNNDQ